LSDSSTSHCRRSTISAEKSGTKDPSGCLSEFATHPIDPKQSVDLPVSRHSMAAKRTFPIVRRILRQVALGIANHCLAITNQPP
jgi:hypothetical protein